MPIGVGSSASAGSPFKTLSELRTAVRDNVDESTAAFWTDAQILRYLNRAKDRVWLEVRKLKDDFFMETRSSTDGSLTILGDSYAASSFAIVAGTRDYTLPPDFVEMKLVEVITSSYEQIRFVHADLAHPDMRAALEIVDNQNPGYFLYDIIAARTMRIAPKSNTALDLRISYVQIIPDLSGEGSELTLPHPLYLAVEQYATAAALKQDRNPDAATFEASGNAVIASVFGAHARQTADIETAIGYGGWA